MTRLLTVADLADEVQMSRGTIRQAIATGDLVGFRFGNEYRVRREDADRWIDSHMVTGESAPKPVTLARGTADPYALRKVAS